MKYITETMEHYLYQEDIEILRDFCRYANLPQSEVDEILSVLSKYNSSVDDGYCKNYSLIIPDFSLKNIET